MTSPYIFTVERNFFQTGVTGCAEVPQEKERGMVVKTDFFQTGVMLCAEVAQEKEKEQLLSKWTSLV